MKTIATLCLCVLIAVEAKANFKMPKEVYRMDRLEEAKAEATSNGRAITIIFTREKTSCRLNEAASLNAAGTLRRETVVVYADCDTEWNQLPATVQEALRSPEAGRFVPKTVILDAGLNNVLAIVPYANGGRYDRLLKDAMKKLPEAPSKSGLRKKLK